MIDEGFDIVGQEIRDIFHGLINSAHKSFDKRLIIWSKQTTKVNRFGEDTGPQFVDTPLLCLINYNYKRAWPVTQNTEAGEMDRESAQVYFNKDYLRSLGLINDNNYFDYDSGTDRFLLDGLVYSAQGDTAVAQLDNDDLFITVILKREATATGDNR